MEDGSERVLRIADQNRRWRWKPLYYCFFGDHIYTVIHLSSLSNQWCTTEEATESPNLYKIVMTDSLNLRTNGYCPLSPCVMDTDVDGRHVFKPPLKNCSILMNLSTR